MRGGLGVFGLCLRTISDDIEVDTFVGITSAKVSSAASEGLRNGK